jgi:hypothetical protein
LVQKALNDGRLKFGDKTKPQMQIDEDPLQVSDASYVEPVHCMMVDAMDLTGGGQIVAVSEDDYAERVEGVYPKADEKLVDFLNRCHSKNSEVMLCPCCSAVFDKKAADGLKKYVPFSKNRGNWPNQKMDRNKNVIHYRPVHQRLGYQSTFVPPNKFPENQWVHGQQRATDFRFFEKGSSSKPQSQVAQASTPEKACTPGRPKLC